MSDILHGLVALHTYSFYLQVFGAALVFILVSILFLLFLGELRTEARNISCIVAISLISLGLILFNVYVNMLRLRRKFPANWIFCCTIALLLALGNACLLPSQDGEDYVWVLEVMALICFYLLIGFWLPPNCPPMLYIALTSFIVCVVVFFCLLFAYRCCVDCDILIYTVDAAMWVFMCPIMLFQAQVIHGHQQTILPFLDIPLCSVLLLIDFLTCYTFLTGVDDMIMATDIFSASNTKMLGDIALFYST